MDRLFRSLLFPALMIIGLITSGFVIVASLNASTAQESAPMPTGKIIPTPSPDLAAQGRALFVAKGCVVCHRHDTFATTRGSLGFAFDDAPNLTTVATDADYLRRWLRDPKALKPTTYMPNLNLSENEINALVAFLTKKS